MILDEAKEKVYNSPIMKFVSKEKIEEAFSRIHVYEDEEAFYKEYGIPQKYAGFIEGFNRADGSHIGPNATPHTIIHEVLHYLSSKFDKNGHRITNGLMGDKNFGVFADQVNEGVTDFLACIISGEEPRHYIQGHKIFRKIEPIMREYYNNQDILFELYIDQNDIEFKRFLDFTLAKNGGAKDFYDNFLYYNDEKIENMQKQMNKKVNRNNNFFGKVVKKIKAFFQKSDIKYLNSGGNNYQSLDKDEHQMFIEKYSVSRDELKENIERNGQDSNNRDKNKLQEIKYEDKVNTL